MSKRSGLSRLEDLKRWFVDVGRYPYTLHKIDMERWRDYFCPVCGEGFDFVKEPNYRFMSWYIHTEQFPNTRGEDCSVGPVWDSWLSDFYDQEYGGEA